LWTMCSHHSWFSYFAPLSWHTKVILSDNSTIPATGSGHLNVKMFTNGKWSNTVLQDVLYVPDLHRNLLSVLHLAWRGADVLFSGEACQVFNHHKSPILEGGLHNNLYIMNMQVTDYITANVATFSPQLMNANLPLDCALTVQLITSSAPLNLWHHCLGHLNFNAIKRMADEGLVTSMTFSNRDMPTDPFEPCLEGKQTHEVIHKITMTCTKHVLSHMHTDICGPLPVHLHHSY